MNDLIELYMEGLPLGTIAEELALDDVDTVIESLRGMKKKSENGRDYVQEFKEMVVERVVSGAKKGQVTKELGIAYRTINKYLEEFNAYVPKNKQEDEDNMYKEIEWSSFHICPDCQSMNVNDLNIYKQEGLDLNNSYCLECGTEWLEREGKTYKVLWEFVR